MKSTTKLFFFLLFFLTTLIDANAQCEYRIRDKSSSGKYYKFYIDIAGLSNVILCVQGNNRSDTYYMTWDNAHYMAIYKPTGESWSEFAAEYISNQQQINFKYAASNYGQSQYCSNMESAVRLFLDAYCKFYNSNKRYIEAFGGKENYEADKRQEEKKERQSMDRMNTKLNSDKSSVLDIEMVFVQGGTFQMGNNDAYGDEKPSHLVTVNSFYIGKYEVTQAQWEQVMGSNPSKFADCKNCPVERVSWDDVQVFITKLNTKTGKNYRLPTEAEWEFAARGGIKSKGYTYSGSNNYWDVARCSSGNTEPVGLRKSNELGLYDMSGNVYEWCSDWMEYNYYSNCITLNPSGPSSGSSRVRRGGSYLVEAGGCRNTSRSSAFPSEHSDCTGFRLVSTK